MLLWLNTLKAEKVGHSTWPMSGGHREGAEQRMAELAPPLAPEGA